MFLENIFEGEIFRTQPITLLQIFCKFALYSKVSLKSILHPEDTFQDLHAGMNVLTHTCLEISETSSVWTFDTFQNNFVINQKFTKHFKGSCELDFDQLFPFKYFLKIAFIREISPK